LVVVAGMKKTNDHAEPTKSNAKNYEKARNTCLDWMMLVILDRNNNILPQFAIPYKKPAYLIRSRKV